MKEATERQQEVLDFIANNIQEHAYPPTVREVARHFGLSVKGAHDHIRALKKKGLLKEGDKRSRTLELAKTGQEILEFFVEVPFLGTVAAGRPILAEENRDGIIRLPLGMLKRNGQYFALRVRGDSMVGAGIMDGDIAVIEQQSTARDGDIVVIMLEDAVTLKTFYREKARIRLQPENPRYLPIYCSQDVDVRILGRLAHIYRSYDTAGSAKPNYVSSS
jgi:repressor LexA